MSKNVTFKLNLKGLNELMKSSEMCSVLNEKASAIATSAGEGFEVEAAHPIRFIGIASVKATTWAAYKAAMDGNALEIARGGVR